MTNEDIKKRVKQAAEIITAVMAISERPALVENIAECTLWNIAEDMGMQGKTTAEEIKKRAGDFKETIISTWHGTEEKDVYFCVDCTVKSFARDLGWKGEK